MNKTLKKIISAITLVTLFSGLLMSCTDKDKTDDSDFVTLKWVISGPGMQKDSQLVWNEVNKLLAELLPNTKLDIELIPVSDYADKWKLIESSGKSVDIAWHGWAMDFISEVNQGSYMKLDELMEKYAPKLRHSMPEWVWNNVSVDGNIYAIPCYQMMASAPAGLFTFKEFSDKYFDSEKFEEIMKNVRNLPCGSDPWTPEMFEMVADYMEDLKKDGKMQKGFNPSITDWIPERNVYQGMSIQTAYISFDENGKPTAHDSFSPELSDTFYKYMADFYKKGYIRKDVLTTSSFDDKIDDNGYTLWCNTYDALTEKRDSMATGYDIKVIPLGNVISQPSSAFATNMVIPKTAKNPERAMQFLEILNDPDDTRLYNMMVYGLEGRHYKKTGENTIETFDYRDAPRAEDAYGIYKWIIGNSFNAYLKQGDLPEYNDYLLNDFNVNFTPSKLDGFTFNPESVKVQLTKIENVKNEYRGLRYGVYEDYKSKLYEYRMKIQNCGQQDVIKEIQRQLDAWYEAKQLNK